jgi:hypothetical protein
MQEFTVNAVGKGDKLDMALKGAYNADKYSVIATLGQAGKVRRRSLACRPAGWLAVFSPNPRLLWLHRLRRHCSS